MSFSLSISFLSVYKETTQQFLVCVSILIIISTYRARLEIPVMICTSLSLSLSLSLILYLYLSSLYLCYPQPFIEQPLMALELFRLVPTQF